ncbi:UNVERIFIED_CONTAM: hypothetical protein Slati_2234200 [Sesamum latifolium]|uniref:DUF4283 domain-containing protein n=1 Tax=Sesamum latifolium TaxID=2727402 RepID=A0AAW2WUG6_9LAMI
MEEVIEGELWLFQGQPIILQRWTLGMALRKHKHTEVPVWIKLRYLPVEYWIDEGLSIVASGIGKPLYPDAITKACTRLNFARVCVMLHIDSKLPKHIVIMVLTEVGDERPCKVNVEYEWVPPKYVNCMCLGHSSTTCPAKRVAAKAPVEVYVKRDVHNSEPVMSSTVPMMEPSIVGTDETILEPRLEKVAETVASGSRSAGALPSREDDGAKAKEIVLYNPFDVLMNDDELVECLIKGPNSCSPLLGLK